MERPTKAQIDAALGNEETRRGSARSSWTEELLAAEVRALTLHLADAKDRLTLLKQHSVFRYAKGHPFDWPIDYIAKPQQLGGDAAAAVARVEALYAYFYQEVGAADQFTARDISDRLQAALRGGQ